MKVYITKYALTQGIIEKEVQRSGTSKDMIYYWQQYGNVYFHKGEWFEDKDEAIKRCEQMRINKISSLTIQLKKLESINFNLIIKS